MTENEFNRTREELLENISDLFLKYGLRSTSMNDICTHLKISKKTLYQLFNNKDDVAEQVMLYRKDNSKAQKMIEKLKQQNAIEIMLTIRDQIIKSLNSRLPANYFDLKKYHPEVYQRVNETELIFFHGLLYEVITKGIKEGYFRKDINLEVQIHLFSKQMILLGEPETISDPKYSVETITSTIIENVIRSFCTPEGFKVLEKLKRTQLTDTI